MIKFIKTVVLIGSCSLGGYAQGFQPGFIVKASGDSLNGLVAHLSPKYLDQRCYFRVKQDSEIVVYGPGSIIAYGSHIGRCYETKKLPSTDSLAFVEVLVKGELNLFRYDGKLYLEKDLLYSARPSPGMIRAEAPEFTRIQPADPAYVNQMIRDCGLRTDKKALADNYLIGLLKKYCRCHRTSMVVYQVSDLHRGGTSAWLVLRFTERALSHSH